jgi:hypothetical protein
MKTAVIASVVSSAVAGGSLDITWSDCGSASTHAKTTDVSPASLPLGAETAITGTGDLDKTVSGGTYDMELKAGGGIIDSHFTGNNCDQKDFDLPLGLGKLSWDGLSCPLAAGSGVKIGFKTTLSASLPPALATASIGLKAVDQDKEDVLCVNLDLKAEAEAAAAVAADKQLGVTWSDCSDSSYLVSMKDVNPKTIPLHGTSQIIGTGTLNEEVDEGVTYDMAMETQFTDCIGDASVGKKCNFPLDMGSIEFEGIPTPVKAGEIPINVNLKISSLLPATLLDTTTIVTGTGKTTGNKIFCLNVYTTKSKSADSENGSKLDLTWSDCGDADTKSRIHALTTSPLTDQVQEGGTNTITGTGTLIEDVEEDIQFESSMRVKFVEVSGDAAREKKKNFPLDLGSITFDGIPSPIPAGDQDISVTVSLGKLVPDSVAITTTHVTAQTASGKKLFCLDVNTGNPTVLV